MKKVIFFGKTTLGKRLKTVMERDSDMRVESFCVTSDYYKKGETFCDRPVVCLEELPELYGKDNFEIYMTVRFGKMNHIRAQAFKICDDLGYNIANYVHPSSNNYASKMGRGNIIFPNVFIEENTELGNGNVIFHNSIVSFDNVIGDFNWLVNVNFAGRTIIGNNCFLGNACGTNNSVTIGDENLISAGVIVTKNTKSNSIILPPKNKILDNIDVEILDSLLRKSLPIM